MPTNKNKKKRSNKRVSAKVRPMQFMVEDDFGVSYYSVEGVATKATKDVLYRAA